MVIVIIVLLFIVIVVMIVLTLATDQSDLAVLVQVPVTKYM